MQHKARTWDRWGKWGHQRLCSREGWMVVQKNECMKHEGWLHLRAKGKPQAANVDAAVLISDSSSDPPCGPGMMRSQKLHHYRWKSSSLFPWSIYALELLHPKNGVVKARQCQKLWEHWDAQLIHVGGWRRSLQIITTPFSWHGRHGVVRSQ